MRIAAIYESPYLRGRWERFDLIVEHLRELGHDVIILSLGRTGSEEDDVISVDISEDPLLRVVNEVFYRLTFRSMDKVGYLLSAVPELRRARVDAILFHYVSSGFPIFLMTRYFPKPPRLIFDWNDLSTRMGFWPSQRGFKYRLLRWMEERLMPRLSDGIIVVSSFAKTLLRSWGILASKVLILNEIVALEPYLSERRSTASEGEPGQRPRTLIWHGFLRGYQLPGIRTAIHALALLRKAKTNCRLEIIGPWEGVSSETEVRSLAGSLQVEVEFVGHLEKAALRRRISRADLGLQLLPEDFFARFINGVKLSEYICAGLPVICSNLEGPSELINGNGLMVRSGDAGDLAKKIVTVMGPDYDHFAANSEEIARREFSHDAIGAKVRVLSDFMEEIVLGERQRAGENLTFPA